MSTSVCGIKFPRDNAYDLGKPDARIRRVCAVELCDGVRAVGVGDLAPFLPGHYERSGRWTAGQPRLFPPAAMNVDVGGALVTLRQAQEIDLTLFAVWDNPALTDPANRAGRDHSIYLTTGGAGDAPAFVLSQDPELPAGDGIHAGNTRKVGGFHCLCADVGDIPGHPLSGFAAGDILPASLWDLRHRPVADPEGMAYCEATGKWYQIYLADMNGCSRFNVPFANGGTAVDLKGYVNGSWYWFVELLAKKRLRLLDDAEFQIVAGGSNSRTNIMGSSGPATTGGHVDTEGRRMISNIGLEDCCGVVGQWLADNASILSYEINGGNENMNTNNGNHRGTGQVLTAGGNWGHATMAGPSMRDSEFKRWEAVTYVGGRGCCDSLRRE